MHRADETLVTPLRSGRRFIAAVVLAAVLLLLLTLVASRRDGSPSFAVDPVAMRSPYRNARPGVAFVGDAACARCHSGIAEAFREHPMGRSVSPIAATTVGVHGEPGFRAHGLDYSVVRRGTRVFHVEERRDDRGVVARNEAEVRFALGSGRQGVAFLVDRDGRLFESPMTWYARERRWDLSPGYERRNAHFDRPIQSDCLYCHANRVEPVEGTLNGYRRPIFRGHAIGCERCHGPGALHVARPEVAAGEGPNIVNPGSLEPGLREAVCEQCHLLGEHRVVRAGRRNEDFRPGLPFYRYWSVFVRPDDPDTGHFVGQVEQMHASRCFRESRGSLGCISCHDPHRLPADGERAAYYRERCLRCHEERGCGLPEDRRRTPSREDDCVSCHMPRSEQSKNVHLATTDHRVPRRAEMTRRPDAVHGGLEASTRQLVPFHEALMDAGNRAAAARDLGIALCRGTPEDAEVALPMLEAAVAALPDDLDAWEGKALALAQLGRAIEGLAALRKPLAAVPARESSLVCAATLAAGAGRREDAISYWERAVALNPASAYYRAELSQQYELARNWPLAAAACREALELEPWNIAARKRLVRVTCRLGDLEVARSEFETLLRLAPAETQALRRWFTQQAGAPGGRSRPDQALP